MRIHTIRWAIALVLASCATSQPPAQGPATGDPGNGAVERQALSHGECEAKGGSVVGDIGDGATQRPGYVCPSGKPPLGNIAPQPGGPIAVEGAVCCPR